MGQVSDFEIKVYHNNSELPVKAEELFARQLADSRQQLPLDRPDFDQWQFALVCAVAHNMDVLGGVYLDIGPINGSGPLANQKLAYLERIWIQPEYRRHGIASVLLQQAIQVAADSGCEYIRCSCDWKNEAEMALFRRCGFALVDLNSEKDEDPSYLAVRPVQNVETPLSCSRL